jgi:hypothetical protein
VPSHKARRFAKDREIFWLIVVTIYFAGTLSLGRLIGVYFSPVQVVVTGLTMLAGWSSADWVMHRLIGRRSRRQTTDSDIP